MYTIIFRCSFDKYDIFMSPVDLYTLAFLTSPFSPILVHQTENGLVEAVAVLVSTMPRMRPDLPSGKLGQCCKTRPDFIKVCFVMQSFDA